MLKNETTERTEMGRGKNKNGPTQQEIVAGAVLREQADLAELRNRENEPDDDVLNETVERILTRPMSSLVREPMDPLTREIFMAIISNPNIYRGAAIEDSTVAKMASRLRKALVDEKLAEPVIPDAKN